MEDRTKEFLIQELHEVYSQAEWVFTQTASLEKLALMSSGIMWAWLATQNWNTLYELIIWFPSIIVLLLYIKVFLLGRSLKGIQSYAVEVEKKFCLENLGWQEWKSKYSKKYMTRWAGIYWLLLFSANTSIAIFFPFSKL